MSAQSPLSIAEIMYGRQVTWIRTHHPHDLFGIELLGGADWQQTREQVAAEIDGNVRTYYTNVSGNVARLETFRHGLRRYVRTQRDGTTVDNLLSLPRR